MTVVPGIYCVTEGGRGGGLLLISAALECTTEFVITNGLLMITLIRPTLELVPIFFLHLVSKQPRTMASVMYISCSPATLLRTCMCVSMYSESST